MTRLAFAPVIPLPLLTALVVLALLVTAYSLEMRARGAWARGLAFAVLLFALTGPLLVKEKRSPLPDVAVIVTDRSQSMGLGKRAAQAEAARAQIKRMLAQQPGLVVRETSVTTTATGENNGTQAFAALNAALADVPQGRVAGAILITDGQVHDAPPPGTFSLHAPLQVLVAGSRGERDRKLTVENAARFAIVGQWAVIRLRVDDLGGSGETGAMLDIRIDGKPFGSRMVPIGQDTDIRLPVAHEGENLVELSAGAGPTELTLQNNHAVVTVSGVRDRLRVLLVSGEPHAGERVWRNLLKADPSVDLVHFTILRPPEKQDGTPINELSLIAFPTRELFQQKISEFQLIIFDRYARQGVLPMIYFDNIARYVRDGGAVLIAAGPDYASPTSIWRTPLDVILPAEPSGEVTEQPFRATLSEAGKRHPVTRGLEGSQSDPPHWSQWFRLVDIKRTTGTNVMQGPDGKPLLVLAREGEGRVALLLSDHIWLWARGYDGGGPHLDLLRRLSHWLMKQPDLEEEALRLIVQGREITVQRQTMADTVNEVTLTSPTGATRTLNLAPIEPGLWRLTLTANELGLWRATDGKLTALANAGPANPREFAEVTSTTEVLRALSNATGGDARRLADGNNLNVPRVVPVRTSSTFKGEDWIGLKMREVSVVRGICVLPIFAGLIGLLLLVGSLAATWAREGR